MNILDKNTLKMVHQRKNFIIWQINSELWMINKYPQSQLVPSVAEEKPTKDGYGSSKNSHGSDKLTAKPRSSSKSPTFLKLKNALEKSFDAVQQSQRRAISVTRSINIQNQKPPWRPTGYGKGSP